MPSVGLAQRERGWLRARNEAAEPAFRVGVKAWGTTQN